MPRDAPCVPRCAEMRRNIYTYRIWRSLEHRKRPRFAPRARNSPRVPRFASRAEIRVAWTPSDDEPFPHFSLSLPRNTFLFWNPHRDIYIYAYSLIFNTPRYFGRRNTRTFPMFQRSSLRLSRGGAVQDRACLSLPLEQRGPPCFSTWSIRVWHAPVLCARG